MVSTLDADPFPPRLLWLTTKYQEHSLAPCEALCATMATNMPTICPAPPLHACLSTSSSQISHARLGRSRCLCQCGIAA